MTFVGDKIRCVATPCQLVELKYYIRRSTFYTSTLDVVILLALSFTSLNLERKRIL
jgi:hypothetical protein